MDKVYHFFLVGIFLGIVGIIAGEDVIHGDEAVSEQKNDLRKYHHHYKKISAFHILLMNTLYDSMMTTITYRPRLFYVSTSTTTSTLNTMTLCYQVLSTAR